MIEFDAVDGRRVAVRSKARMTPNTGVAKLVVTGAAGGLSSEMLGLAYGPTANVQEFVTQSKLRSLGRKKIAQGTVSLYAVTTAEIAVSGLPAETRIGTLEMGGVTAHGYFYRPFNRMTDVIEYFETLDLTPALNGVVVPREKFEVIDQAYRTSAEGVSLVSVEPPRGVPAGGAAPAPAGGRMWVDRVPGRTSRVVYENRAARLGFLASGWRKQAATEITPEFERAVIDMTRGLSAVTWN